MPLKITVGLSQKVGQPRFGSRGATCQVEFEAEGALLKDDFAGFHQQVQSAYQACRQAVQEELCRAPPDSNAPVPREVEADNGSHQRGSGDGHAPQPVFRSATSNQVRAIQSIARQLELNLGAWLNQKFSVNNPEQLSVRDASRAIDALRLLQAVAQEAMTAPEPRPRGGANSAAANPEE